MTAVKTLLKNIARGVAVLMVFPCALLSGFGRVRAIFRIFSEALAFMPGTPGSYLRVAYYVLTLRRFSFSNYMGLGSFFAHPEATVGDRGGIGAYCILGRVNIGDHALIADRVQILSGRRQHFRDAQGNLTDEGRRFTEISIGAECWIGAASIIMASVGRGATVTPGSVIAFRIPDGATAGNEPAKVVREQTEAT
jgi:virginiamycin A acetyltransferase